MAGQQLVQSYLFGSEVNSDDCYIWSFTHLFLAWLFLNDCTNMDDQRFSFGRFQNLALRYHLIGDAGIGHDGSLIIRLS